MSDYTKELIESLGLGFVVAAPFKAAVEYGFNGKKPSFKSFGTDGAIVACADIIYNYGKSKKWWFWL